MEKRITSENYYHKKPERLNCAQAILKSFQKEFGIENSLIEEFKVHGGGRAPNGVCGALYAAEYISEKHNLGSLAVNFAEKTGHVNCRELKNVLKFPCVECVKIADKLLSEKKNDSRINNLIL